MPSFKNTFLAVAAAFAAIAHADYVIDPSSVPLSTRTAWCVDEKRTCPFICQQTEPGTTLINECDPKTLTYGCICGNNKQPNISEFTLTLPYFVCTEWGTQCVKACGSDNICASDCRQKHPCGAQNPQRPNTSSTSDAPTTTPTASETSGALFTGLAGETGTPSGGSSSSVLDLGRGYGLAVVLGGLFVGFAML